MATIAWTDNAKKDLKEIHEFIAADSKYYAHVFVEKIKNIVKNVSQFPLMGRSVPEYNLNDLREIIFHNYRIIYKIYFSWKQGF